MARRPFVALAVLSFSLLAIRTTPARAEFGEDLADYGTAVGTQFLVGLNGVLTAVADPFLYAWSPPDDVQDFAVPEVTSRALGFFGGVAMAGFRAFTGGYDMACAIFPVEEMSPEPEVMLFPGVEPASGEVDWLFASGDEDDEDEG